MIQSSAFRVEDSSDASVEEAKGNGRGGVVLVEEAESAAYEIGMDEFFSAVQGAFLQKFSSFATQFTCYR